MNTKPAPNPLRFAIQKTNKVCPVHNTRMLLVLGRLTCEKCSEEFMIKNEEEHSQSLSERLIRNRVVASMMPSRHVNCKFQSFKVDHVAQQTAVKKCVDFAEQIVNGGSSSLILCGTTGTGKTHLSCAVIRAVLRNFKSARYITSFDLANELMSAWGRNGDDEHSVIARYADYDLLVIDEYGLHDRDKKTDQVHKVMYQRYDLERPTMLISNLSEEKLQDDLGSRLWSRLNQGGDSVVRFNWTDARTIAK